MAAAPETKRKKLNTALAQAIGLGNQQSKDDLEEKMLLALMSEDADAKTILSNPKYAFRQKEIFEAVLKICGEKGSDVCVNASFIAYFTKYFPILGVDSAKNCWKSIHDSLLISKSENEAKIATEFIKSSNLLGHGFRIVTNYIKTTLPNIILNFWAESRTSDAISLGYSLICLLLAEESYSDYQSLESSADFWTAHVLAKNPSISKSFEIRILSILAQCQPEKFAKNLEKLNFLAENRQQLLSIFFNHFEFYATILPESVAIHLLASGISEYAEKNNLKILSQRLRTCELEISGILQLAIKKSLAENLEFIDVSAEESPKDVAKNLEKMENCSISKIEEDSSQKIEKILNFIAEIQDLIEDDTHHAKLFFTILEIRQIFENAEKIKFEVERISKFLFDNKKEEIFDKFWKKAKKIDKLRPLLEQSKKEEEKFVELAPQEAVDRIEAVDGEDVKTVLEILKGVHLLETKKAIFDPLMSFIENLEGGQSLLEVELYLKLVKIYGKQVQESMCCQVIFARMSLDGWAGKEKLEMGEEEEAENDEWFEILAIVIELLDSMLKNMKNSILKSFTAVFCHQFTLLLKNVQKYVNQTQNASKSQTIDEEKLKLKILQKHKVVQDVSRIVDSMKRDESYFSMITASIISDTVFFGNMTILAMAKLHGLADKNAQALLATNLPVIERTRYAKFLPIINKASKKVY